MMMEMGIGLQSAVRFIWFILTLHMCWRSVLTLLVMIDLLQQLFKI